MREKDIHNLIEQQDDEAKQRIWQKISSQIDVTPAPCQKTVTKKKIGLLSALAVALVCLVTLSIVLPLVLRDNEPQIRYCDESQYTTESFSQTLKEYSLSHNNVLRYVDWYENADQVITSYGYNKEDKNDILFFKEKIVNSETGEVLFLSVTDSKTQVDIFDAFLIDYMEILINDVVVRYDIANLTQCSAMFEYENHMYYMQLHTADGLARLTEVIKGMLK